MAKKYSHSTFLAAPTRKPEQQVIVITFPSSLFSSPHEREMLLQKAQRIKEFQHPHLLPILDMGIEGEQPFVVRDYLPNRSLRSHLKQISPQRLELRDALTIVLQVGEALTYAHQQFNYVGGGWQHSLSECPGSNCRGTLPYNESNSWDSNVNEYVTISFTGIQINCYVIMDVPHGIGAVSIDGGSETLVDCYAPIRNGNQLLWTSSMLPAGNHTFKLRVTGKKNPKASGLAVVPDRVDILG